jgi:hypothetical protein
MARDKVDLALLIIINDHRKGNLGSYATNEDNISADKEAVVKRMKLTINNVANNHDASCEHKKTTQYIDNTSKLLCKVSLHQHDTVEEVEETYPTAKILVQSYADNKKGDSTQKCTKVNQPILDINNDSADEDDSPAPHPKKTKH